MKKTTIDLTVEPIATLIKTSESGAELSKLLDKLKTDLGMADIVPHIETLKHTRAVLKKKLSECMLDRCEPPVAKE